MLFVLLKNYLGLSEKMVKVWNELFVRNCIKEIKKEEEKEIGLGFCS